MKTKIIPFDLELAKKIQAGEIQGKIKDQDGIEGTILTFEGINTPLPIIVRFHFSNGDNIFFIGNDGKGNNGLMRLSLEIPDNEPQFKPFDKVLVRDRYENMWRCSLFSHEDENGYCASGFYWRECIPYEGNEHLVGTTDKPKEE